MPLAVDIVHYHGIAFINFTPLLGMYGCIFAYALTVESPFFLLGTLCKHSYLFC